MPQARFESWIVFYHSPCEDETNRAYVIAVVDLISLRPQRFCPKLIYGHYFNNINVNVITIVCCTQDHPISYMSHNSNVHRE